MDASRPENLVEIGNYDTWQSNTTGFHGAWGAYPFLPSGLILVSDIESGLYVLEPKYQRAAYLEGTVRDSVNGNPLTGVSVAIIAEQTNTASSGLNGIYKTGLGTPGTFTVIFSKPGYINKLISGVVLESGVVRQLDVQLKPQATGRLRGIIVDDANGIPIPEVKLQIANREFTYDLQSNANGQFIFPDVFLGEYQLYAGAWGYENIAIETVRINEGDQSINIRLKAGYADDFAVDLGWTTAAAGATSGFWVRDIPIGTRFGSQFANPLLDLPDDIGDLCFMTGNGGGDAGTDDVDNGLVTLTSPPMDWSSYDTASFSLQYWLFNGGGSGIPNDTLKIFISNGADTLQLANIAQIHVSDWQLFDSGELSDRIAFTENMQLIVEAGDVLPNGHIVEAAIDAFRVQGGTLVSSVQDIAAAAPDWLLAPNPFSSSTSLRLSPEWSAAGPVTLRVMDALGRPLMQRTLDGSDNQFELGGQLVPGVYWVSLEAGRPRSVKRIVKQ